MTKVTTSTFSGRIEKRTKQKTSIFLIYAPTGLYRVESIERFQQCLEIVEQAEHKEYMKSLLAKKGISFQISTGAMELNKVKNVVLRDFKKLIHGSIHFTDKSLKNLQKQVEAAKSFVKEVKNAREVTRLRQRKLAKARKKEIAKLVEWASKD